jgi:hypothetical protein
LPLQELFPVKEQWADNFLKSIHSFALLLPLAGKKKKKGKK